MPDVGQLETVTIDGYDLHVLPGTYKRDPAPRFGDKISTGDLRYADFNPYESAASYSTFERGFGLRRFSDLPEGANPNGFYAETSNVDARSAGVCVSPAMTPFLLGGGVGSPIWMGEWTPSTGAITGAHFVFITPSTSFYLTAATTKAGGNHLFTPMAAAVSAVTPAGGQLIIGGGSSGAARYITSLDGTEGFTGLAVQDTATNPLFVYATAVDRAAIYIAGGTASTNVATVLSAPLTAANPAQSFAVAANAVTCGDPSHPITALLPGGGVAGALVFVCKDNEFGFIDTSSVYHTLMPFQQVLSTNGVGMRWWLPSGAATDQVGSVIVFPLGRSLWAYSPSAGFNNMAAEGREGFRPINARGVVTAMQSTSHYLYYAVNPTANTTNNTTSGIWLIANDGVSGANHTYRLNNIRNTSFGVSSGAFGFSNINLCNAMGVTSLFGSNPILYFGLGTTNVVPGTTLSYVGSIILPADGDWPPADSNCTYDTGSSNTLLLPDIDFGFPDEDKVATFLRLTADNLVSGAQFIIVDYAADGSSTYTNLGTFFISPFQEIPFPSLTFKRISLRLTMKTTDTTKTPILYAVSMRASINPKQYTLWTMSVLQPTGSTLIGTGTAYNPNTVITNLWSAYKTGTPVTYTDRWNKQWLVRLLTFNEHELSDESLWAPNTAMDMTLLELYATGLESAWDQSNTIWDAPQSTWG